MFLPVSFSLKNATRNVPRFAFEAEYEATSWTHTYRWYFHPFLFTAPLRDVFRDFQSDPSVGSGWLLKDIDTVVLKPPL